MSITIGLPFYNPGPYLAEAIRSVFAQTVTDWTLLLVDDGSTDGSVQVAAAIRDPRVQLICDGRNKGLAARLNEISHLAPDRYLARLDADDLMHPQRLAHQLQYLLEHPEVDLLGTATYVVDADDHLMGVRGAAPLHTEPLQVLAHGLFIHPTVTGTAEWFRNHPYDPDFGRAQDLELWCRTIGHSCFARLASPLYYYREMGVFSLLKYMHSQRYRRIITRRHGPRLVGRPATAALLAGLWLKDSAYKIMDRLGRADCLVAGRGRPVELQERVDGLRALQTIFATPVPGLDEAEGEFACPKVA